MKIENAKFGLLVQEKSTGDLFRIADVDVGDEFDLRVKPNESLLDCVSDWVKSPDFRIYKGEKIQWKDLPHNTTIYVKDSIKGLEPYLDDEYKEVLQDILKQGYGFSVKEGQHYQIELCSKEGGKTIFVEKRYLKKPRSITPTLGI